MAEKVRSVFVDRDCRIMGTDYTVGDVVHGVSENDYNILRSANQVTEYNEAAHGEAVKKKAEASKKAAEAKK